MSVPIRQRALIEARSWIGTPYRHQGSVKGQGADCLGLIRGVWRALYGPEPQITPAYSPDWAERGGEETLMNAARRWLAEIPLEEVEPGDVLLFRFSAASPAKHCGVMSARNRMIHAWHGQAVCETAQGPWFRRRRVAAFRFPDPDAE